MLRSLGLCVLTITVTACSSTSSHPRPSASARLPSLPSYTDGSSAESATCAHFRTFLARLQEDSDPKSDRQALTAAAIQMHAAAVQAQSFDQNSTYVEQLENVSAAIVGWVQGESLSQTVTDPPVSTMGTLCR